MVGTIARVAVIKVRAANSASLLLAILIAGWATGCHPSSNAVAPLPFTPAPGIPMARKIPELERFIKSEMARENIPGLQEKMLHALRAMLSSSPTEFGYQLREGDHA
jgi:hypothetical protein